MKIILNEKGFAIVTSESLSESIKLQEQFMGKKMGRPYGSKNERKLERRKDCPYCGKRIKRLRLHILQKHPMEYKKLYGEVTTGGKTVDSLMNGNNGWERRMKQLVVN
jgi:hypothetical protein